MPRKPIPKKQKITIVVEGVPIMVNLTPPSGTRTSWYAYWTGLVTSKSTGHSELGEAIKSVEDMLRHNGKKSSLADTVLSDSEFEEIQRRHYGKRTDPEAQSRARKSLRERMDAITAFREISGLRPITIATPDDCERFQQEALKRPKNWRIKYADNRQSLKRREKKGEVGALSSNTVVKWSVALQAAFERATRSAGKKCVRGVVPESKLLDLNPWRNFTWIEGSKKKLRQFDQEELISLLDYFDAVWPGVTFAPAFVKVSLWSWARRLEVSSLRWSDERKCGAECHFESTGKWGVRKWFRVPDALRSELEALKNGSPFVFGCYPEQLRDFHLRHVDTFAARQVRLDFAPEKLGDWVYRQVCDWSKTLPKGAAYLHVFRKTSLQYALSGGHVEQDVADDASVTSTVMMASYAQVLDEELRHKSNRTHRRIRASLTVEVAARYGFQEKPADRLVERLDLARSQGDWAEVQRLAEQLRNLDEQVDEDAA